MATGVQDQNLPWGMLASSLQGTLACVIGGRKVPLVIQKLIMKRHEQTELLLDSEPGEVAQMGCQTEEGT